MSLRSVTPKPPRRARVSAPGKDAGKRRSRFLIEPQGCRSEAEATLGFGKEKKQPRRGCLGLEIARWRQPLRGCGEYCHDTQGGPRGLGQPWAIRGNGFAVKAHLSPLPNRCENFEMRPGGAADNNFHNLEEVSPSCDFQKHIL